MKYVKNQVYKTFYQSSTITKGTMAELGTIEKDACSYFGKHDSKPFDGYEIIKYAIKNLNFKTVLDVGAGRCLQTKFLKEKGKKVYTCDFENIDGAHCSSNIKYDYSGDFLDINFNNEKFDFVFSSHVLEHQRNVGMFLDKMASLVSENGFICIVLPIRKPFVTGGHLSIWNPGILLYNLVMAGVDCSECCIIQKDYDIGLVVKFKKFDINKHSLTYDRGDVDLLSKYFPFELKEPFNGDIMNLNTINKIKRIK